MSQRLLVSDLQASRIPASLNICATDERFYAWLNEAEEMMLAQGRWWGSTVEAQFCTRSGCLVFPRQVAEVERIAVCGGNVQTENGWFAFTRQIASVIQRDCGTGSCSSGSTPTNQRNQYGSCFLQARERRGEVCSFSSTLGQGKIIRSYPTNVADVGKKIIYQGYDSNGIWVRTVYDGDMRDGEQVTLAMPFVDTVTTWNPGNPYAVVKEVTAQRVLVYEYDSDTTTERQLADYEPGETNPSYRVSFIPGLRNATNGNGCCSSDTDDDRRVTVTCMVSLRHIPFTSPGDWLILQNLPAYKAAMMAVKAWEEGDEAKGNYYFYGTQAAPRNARGPVRVVNRGGAIPLLQAELIKQTGGRTNAYIFTDEVQKMTRQMAGFW